MKYLVTGTAGFIGSHVAAALLKRNDFVFGVDEFNDYYSVELKGRNLALLQGFKNFEYHKGDFCDYSLMREVFARFNPDVVIHLGARAGVRPSLREPVLYFRTNVDGTANLLERSRWHNVKNFVFASSSSVYGERNIVPFSESDALDPISPYAATKQMGEVLCGSYARSFGLPVTCLRFFTVYGPRGRPDMAPRKFMEKIMRGEEIEVYGDWEETSRDYTFIDDIVSGVISAADNPNKFEIVNLGNSSPVTLKEMVGLIADTVGKKPVISFLPSQEGDVSKTYADVSKASRLYGWSPGTSLRDGLRKQFEYLVDLEFSKAKALSSSPVPFGNKEIN